MISKVSKVPEHEEFALVFVLETQSPLELSLKHVPSHF